LLEETREGVNLIKDQEMKDSEERAKTTTAASNANHVKSRKEVLAEQTYEQKVRKH
jgi:hypothetical protein